MKDLVDLVLMIERGAFDQEKARPAVAATFVGRRRHAMPGSLSPSPRQWAAGFLGMAQEAQLSTANSREAFAILDCYWADDGLGAGGRTE